MIEFDRAIRAMWLEGTFIWWLTGRNFIPSQVKLGVYSRGAPLARERFSHKVR